jgi:hypothetical protein
MTLRLLPGMFLLLLVAIAPVASQDAPPKLGPEEEDVKLPNGKSQRDEILKAEREENIKDAAHLVELAEALKSDLQKTDRFVLSMDTLKKTDDIDKLVKKIRNRLHH